MNNQKELVKKFITRKVTDAELRSLAQMLTFPESWNDDYQELWEEAGGVLPEDTDKKLWNSIREDTTPEVKRFNYRLYLEVAACALLIFVSASYFLMRRDADRLRSYADTSVYTARGQHATVTLPDGTIVQMNALSGLVYGKSFNEKVRNVTLTGEASFVVAHNKNAPFRVSTGNITVTALGTKFSIRAYPDENTITTSLIEGKVRVSSPAETLFLSPGQAASYDTGLKSLSKDTMHDTLSCTAWMRNEMVFENTMFSEVLNDLKRHYDIEFRVKNERLLMEPLSGTLKNTNLQNVMDVLSKSLGFHYTLHDKYVSIKKNVPNKTQLPMKQPQ